MVSAGRPRRAVSDGVAVSEAAEPAFLPMPHGSPHAFGWLASSRRDRALDLETSWSEAVPGILQGLAGEYLLPIVVAPARRDHRGNALVITSLPVVVGGGTGNAWANPQPAQTPRRLVIGGGFVVDGGRDRHLQERARVLGFGNLRTHLRTHLQARCDAGSSVPRIASELSERLRTVMCLRPRPRALVGLVELSSTFSAGGRADAHAIRRDLQRAICAFGTAWCRRRAGRMRGERNAGAGRVRAR